MRQAANPVRLKNVYSVARTTKGAFARSAQRFLEDTRIKMGIISLSMFSAGILAMAYGRPAIMDNWVRFDLVVTFICIVDLFISHIMWVGNDIPVSMPAVRMLRTAG